MFAAYTSLQNAQTVKEFLIQKKILHPEYLPVKEMGFIYFPLTRKMNVPNAKVTQPKFSFPSRQSSITIEGLLQDKLTKKELELIPKSQEVVGSILILEIPEELHRKEKAIAQAYLKLHKNLQTVVKKEEAHSGVYRTRKVHFLAGKNTTETIHTESGLRFKIDVEKMYFTSRLGNERLRITKLVKKGEEVLIMFSGAGPYPLVIAKRSPAKKVYGIEINPLAHRYAVDNVVLNKLEDKVSLQMGDVCEVVPKLRQKFDRIVMPLPKTGEEFLETTLRIAKKGAMIHYYSFLGEQEIDLEAKRIAKVCKTLGKPVRVVRKVTCGQFSPRTFRVCFDLGILK